VSKKWTAPTSVTLTAVLGAETVLENRVLKKSVTGYDSDEGEA
jgi:hypothetical protein